MWPNPQFPANLVTFTEEILNGKLHFWWNDVRVLVGYSIGLVLTIGLGFAQSYGKGSKTRFSPVCKIEKIEILFKGAKPNKPIGQVFRSKASKTSTAQNRWSYLWKHRWSINIQALMW